MSVGQRALQPDGRSCSDASHIVKPIKTISVTTSRARTLSLKIPSPLFALRLQRQFYQPATDVSASWDAFRKLSPSLSPSSLHTGLDESRQAAAGAFAETHLDAFLPTPRKLGGTDRVALNTGHLGLSRR
jgi:hypothetical protein